MSGLLRIYSDSTNTPSVFSVGGILLPSDTICYLNGKKAIVMDKILDGVSVTERILRNPYEIEIEFILREYTNKGEINYDYTSYIFPQKKLEDIWNSIWLPDSVRTIENTYLNGLGIFEIVIESVAPVTFRGSKNIQVRLRGYENVPGQTLIIS